VVLLTTADPSEKYFAESCSSETRVTTLADPRVSQTEMVVFGFKSFSHLAEMLNIQHTDGPSLLVSLDPASFWGLLGSCLVRANSSV